MLMDTVNIKKIIEIPYIYIYEPVSVKTGLNDMEMKIQKTALRESINLSECFLKI